jgi:hypothetical protein
MKKSKRTYALFAAAFAGALGSAPQLSDAATLTGCGGGAFGADCSLGELIAGGTILIGPTLFSDFSLSPFAGRALDTTVIRVDPIDTPLAPGLRLVDTGNTMRAENSDATQNDFGFKASVIGNALGFNGGSLRVDTGGLSGDGSFTSVFEIILSSDFATVLGANDIICDPTVTPSCANSTLSDSADLGRVSGVAITGGLDVVADTTGVADINSVTFQFLRVPEPASLALVAMGLLACAASRRRKA